MYSNCHLAITATVPSSGGENFADEAFEGANSHSVRIPAKANADSEGNANGIPGRRRTFSERSDAGTSIVQEVFGFVKRNLSERSEGRMPRAEKGVRGKGR